MNVDNNHYEIIKSLLKNNPNIISLTDIYDYFKIKKIFDNFNTLNKIEEYTPYENDFIIDSKMLAMVNDDIFISYIISDKLSEQATISNIVFLYLEDNNLIQDIIKAISLTTSDDIVIKNNLNHIALGKTGTYMLPMEIDNNLDFNLCYNKETIKEIKDLWREIKNGEFGVWVLHGETGSGKTSSLKAIANKNEDVNFIYITYNNLESINSQEIYDFILNNNQTIFIIDDFEKMFTSFDIRSNQTIINISQILDNFLFKKSTVGFILIINTEDISIESEEYDSIFKLNSFKKDIEFKKLEKSKIEKLAKVLDRKLDMQYSLSDIINNHNRVQKKYTGF